MSLVQTPAFILSKTLVWDSPIFSSQLICILKASLICLTFRMENKSLEWRDLNIYSKEMKHKSSYDSISNGFNKLTIDYKDKPFAAYLNNQLAGYGQSKR